MLRMVASWGRMARIFVIDDDANMRALMDEMLRAAGHEVVLDGVANPNNATH